MAAGKIPWSPFPSASVPYRVISGERLVLPLGTDPVLGSIVVCARPLSLSPSPWPFCLGFSTRAAPGEHPSGSV